MFAVQKTTKVRDGAGAWIDGPEMIFTKNSVSGVFEADGQRALLLNNRETYYVNTSMADILSFLNS